MSAVVPPDPSIEVADGGGQVWPLALVDKQSADRGQLIGAEAPLGFDPYDQFDLVFIHEGTR